MCAGAMRTMGKSEATSLGMGSSNLEDPLCLMSSGHPSSPSNVSLV